MKKNPLRILILVLLALLTALPASAEVYLPTIAPAETAAVPEGIEAPIAKSDIRDDGIVRVHLMSLGRPGSLTITLDGVYTVEHNSGMRFMEGSEIVLSEADGNVWLSAGGLALDMGPSLTLTRQASDRYENGLRIAEAKEDNLYMGDLCVTCENGALRAVLSIQIEDYLCGVVAYEMSDAWPLEALKAQAVAARTYAMQRKWSAGDQDYDLVDTTGDQVFKGYNPQYKNVEEAVRATEGVVGMWNGSFATCYYTASNGGETAMVTDVWTDREDQGYLARNYDPYDLQNPYAIVNDVHFRDDASDLPALRDMLQDALKEKAKKLGLKTEGLQLESILSIEPADPVVKGSRMCRKLRFGLRVSMPEMVYLPAADDAGALTPATENKNADLALYTISALRRLLLGSPYVPTMQQKTLDEPIIVELDVYSQIKKGLGLSIQSADYEIVSVVRDADGFSIEMRRFGHGVGMSQRGAQTMAGRHGKTFKQILKFYYPGMALEEISWDAPELESIEDMPAGVGAARPRPTPTPSPAPLPELKDGEYYAVVELDDTSSSLNMRKGPGTQTQVVTRLPSGRRLIVCSEPDADGWVKVKTAEHSGYVKLEYLIKE